MITPRITCCKECVDIVPLIEEIDCRLSKLSSSAYNNIVYSLNNPMDQTEAIILLFYKRILQYKIVNPDYTGAFSVEMIASRIKKYIVGCELNCACKEFMESLGTTTSTTSSTSTTSTSTSTTTTTTTVAPTTTTTTTVISYNYSIGIYNCYCNFIDFGSIFNSQLLTINSFNLNLLNNTIIKIIGFNGAFSVIPTSFILDSNKKNSCGEVVGCPTTTSTTTPTP